MLIVVDLSLLLSFGAFLWYDLDQDLSNHGTSNLKGTDKPQTRVDSQVPLMHHEFSDLGSLILIQITPNKHILNLLLIARFFFFFSRTCLFIAIGKRFRLIFVCLLIGFLIETGPRFILEHRQCR